MAATTTTRIPGLGTYRSTGALVLTQDVSRSAGYTAPEGYGGSPEEYAARREIEREAARLGRESGARHVEIYASAPGCQSWQVTDVVIRAEDETGADAE